MCQAFQNIPAAVAEVFNTPLTLPLRPGAIKLVEDAMSAIQQPQHVSLVASVNANRNILHSDPS